MPFLAPLPPPGCQAPVSTQSDIEVLTYGIEDEESPRGGIDQALSGLGVVMQQGERSAARMTEPIVMSLFEPQFNSLSVRHSEWSVSRSKHDRGGVFTS